MEITYDPAKNAKNIELRGLSFERVAEFDFQTAAFTVDDRRDYDEIISFRKANKREVRRHEQATQP